MEMDLKAMAGFEMELPEGGRCVKCVMRSGIKHYLSAKMMSQEVLKRSEVRVNCKICVIIVQSVDLHVLQHSEALSRFFFSFLRQQVCPPEENCSKISATCLLNTYFCSKFDLKQQKTNNELRLNFDTLYITCHKSLTTHIERPTTEITIKGVQKISIHYIFCSIQVQVQLTLHNYFHHHKYLQYGLQNYDVKMYVMTCINYKKIKINCHLI